MKKRPLERYVNLKEARERKDDRRGEERERENRGKGYKSTFDV